jgi:hypothetical protein
MRLLDRGRSGGGPAAAVARFEQQRASLLRPIRPWKEGGGRKKMEREGGESGVRTPDSGVMTSAVTSQEFKKGKIPIGPTYCIPGFKIQMERRGAFCEYSAGGCAHTLRHGPAATSRSLSRGRIARFCTTKSFVQQTIRRESYVRNDANASNDAKSTSD